MKKVLKMSLEWKDSIPHDERDNNSWWYLHGELEDLAHYDKAYVINCKSGGFGKETVYAMEITGNRVDSIGSASGEIQMCIDGVVPVEIEEISEPCIGYFWTTNHRTVYWQGTPYDIWDQRGLVCLERDNKARSYALERMKTRTCHL